MRFLPQNLFVSLCFALVSSLVATAQMPQPAPAADIQHEVLAASGPLSARINQTELRYQLQVNRTVIEDLFDIYPPSEITSYSYRLEPAQDEAARPIIFAFNGGPGSSSAWLHMGAWGPKRIETAGSPSDDVEAPYELVENPGFLIDVADLVFVDPVNTGLSRVLDGGNANDLYDIRVDARSMCQFVKNWIQAEGREDAPIFLAGESYGALRVSSLYAHPICRQLKADIRGVIYISGMLDLRSRANHYGQSALTEMGRFPTFASIAWYHDLIDRGLWNHDFDRFLDEAKTVALVDLTAAAIRWRYLSQAERQVIIGKIQRFTGISALDAERDTFANIKGLFIVGHAEALGGNPNLYDARYIQTRRGPNASPLPPFSFPEFSKIFRDHLAAYLEAEATFTFTEVYVVLNRTFSSRWRYDYMKSSNVGYGTNMAEILRISVGRKGLISGFRIFSASGLHDTATPFFATEYALEQAGFPSDILHLHRYEGGHMMYLDSDVSLQLANDIRQFIELD